MTKYFALVFALTACGGDSSANGNDAGTDAQYGHKPIDASLVFDAGPEAAIKIPDQRMTAHQGIVMDSIRVRAIYVSNGASLPLNYNAFLQWLLQATDYWSLLKQYGVGYGELVDSTNIDVSTFLQAGDVSAGVINFGTLEARIKTAIAALPAADAGVSGNAYMVFLPTGLNVDLGQGATCNYALGYHSYDGAEPYAVIPQCGEFPVTISHEMAEMATDPIPFAGWYSEADEQPAGGEVGDLCNAPVSVDGYFVTGLWSNADGDCEP